MAGFAGLGVVYLVILGLGVVFWNGKVQKAEDLVTAQEEINFGLERQIAEQTEFFAPLIVEPDGARFRRDELNGVPVEWTEPEGGATDRERVVLYFHGGGYSGGLAAWARRGTARSSAGQSARQRSKSAAESRNVCTGPRARTVAERGAPVRSAISPTTSPLWQVS